MNVFREMVVANQNETVRKDGEQAQVFLATVGLIGCVAVIFYSSLTQRVSLTHTDLKTNFSFLQEEHAWVGSDCRVFLIKNRGDWYLPLQTRLQALAIHDIELLTSSEGTVVFNHVKALPQVFKMADFINLTTPGEMPRPDNKLHNLKYHPTFSEASILMVQKRIYERQLNAAASLISSHMPLLVHQESGWLSTSFGLAEDVFLRIHSGAIVDRTSIDYVWPRYQMLLKVLKENQTENLLSQSAQL